MLTLETLESARAVVRHPHIFHPYDHFAPLMATQTFASLRETNLGQCYSSVISRTFKQKNHNNNASIVFFFLHCFRSTLLKIKG